VAFEARLVELEGEETCEPKGCPKCGQETPVNGSKRPRTVLTLHGPMTYRRYYHSVGVVSTDLPPLMSASKHPSPVRQPRDLRGVCWILQSMSRIRGRVLHLT